MKNDESKQVQVKVDAYTRVCLTVLAVLLTVMAIGLWADGVPNPADAGAAVKFLDSSAQRKAIITEQQETNKKLGEIIVLLKGGQAKVQIVESKKPAPKPKAPPMPKKDK